MEEKSTVYTLAGPVEAALRERGSRFWALLLPVHDREELDKQMKQYQIDYQEATHVCAAWRLRGDEYANDDGEPAHSAGAPMLRRLQGAQLTHVLALVVRWYGGTKLGVSGLIQAYGGVVQLAIEEAQARRLLVPWRPQCELRIDAPYEKLGVLERLIAQNDLQVASKQFLELCNFIIRVPASRYPAIQNLFEENRIAYQLIHCDE